MQYFILLVAFVASTVSAQKNGYLPPQKDSGYNYPTPNVPFPPSGGENRPVPQPGRVPRPPPGPPAQPRPPPGTGYPPARSDTTTEHVHIPGMPFDFAYKVNEDGNDYSHNAISDGDVTRGEYRIAMPDGRTQIVKYTADWKNGYNAEVSYEGQAVYPDQQPRGPGGPGQGYVPPSQGGGYKY